MMPHNSDYDKKTMHQKNKGSTPRAKRIKANKQNEIEKHALEKRVQYRTEARHAVGVHEDLAADARKELSKTAKKNPRTMSRNAANFHANVQDNRPKGSR